MKRLLILRHAKSSWKHAGLSDHERPLNRRGLRDAPRIGRLLARRQLVPERILCSTAVRARTTASLVAEACGHAGAVHLLRELYLGEPAAYLDALARHGEAYSPVMVVGHNPGLEELLALLTGEPETMPTAALAHVELAVDGWSEVRPGLRGRLADFWRPRELET